MAVAVREAVNDIAVKNTVVTCVMVDRDTDIVLACHKGRVLAEQLGLSGNDQAIVVIVISEMARNIVKYAGHGEIILSPAQQNGMQGISIVAHDKGPGIADVDWAMRDGSSTGGGLGLGLSGTKRLVDEFEIVSRVGEGTTITIRKWKSDRG